MVILIAIGWLSSFQFGEVCGEDFCFICIECKRADKQVFMQQKQDLKFDTLTHLRSGLGPTIKKSTESTDQ